MAYSLYFWRETEAALATADEVCAQLCEELAVPGVAQLPMDRIRQSFVDAFPGIKEGASGLEWEGSGSYFEVEWSPARCNLLTVLCGYKLLKSPDTMNRIIDVAAKFGCALYDPQTGERYQQPDPAT